MVKFKKKIYGQVHNVKKGRSQKNSVHRYLLRYLHIKGEKRPNFFSILFLITLIILM